MRLSYIFRHDDLNLYYKGDRDFNITYNRHSAILSPFNFNIRNFSLDIGMRWDYYDYTTMLSNVENEQVETVVDGGHFISYYAGVRYNSENKWHFPTRGSRFNATYSYNTDNFVGYDGSRGYSILSASWRTALPLTRRFTLQPMLYGRMLFGGTIPLCSANIIGGDRFGSYVEQQMPFAGMGHAEHIDNQFVAMQLSAYQRIATNNYVLLKLAAACISHKPADLLREPLTAGCQLAYYYNSMFGPLGGSLGWSNRTRGVYFYINLGFGF
ncbi:phospholipase patatin family [Prevotella sp. CAG:487]|nr:phospholipase patatin family [Prevotella sp. CAG:487]